MLLLTAAVRVCSAGDANDLARENAELKQRVEKLENDLAELKKMVVQQGQAAKAETQAAAAAQGEVKSSTIPQLSDADLQKILAMVKKDTDKKKPVWSNLDIQLYGYIKVDASYDSSRITTGNYAVYADSELQNKNNREFNLTANQTRLGLRIFGPNEPESSAEIVPVESEITTSFCTSLFAR